MKTLGVTLIIYILLLLAGGLFGYLKAHSIVSLLMSMGSSLLLLIALLALIAKKKFGLTLALVVTLLLDGVFTYRFLASSHFFPSGLFAMISLAVLFVLILAGRKL